MTRYSRQIILPELGTEGQHRLRHSRVLCVGTGGLGSPALLYLAAAGVGHIYLMDDDHVDRSNLQRQILFSEAHHGMLKVEAAFHVLHALNSEIYIHPITQRFSVQNAEAMLAQCDVVMDGTDNFASKFLINDACAKHAKPLVYGSILGFDAQVSVFSAAHGPCYRCLYPSPPRSYIPNCAEAGVIGAMAGIAGSIQALETIKLLLGLDWCKAQHMEPLIGRVWMLDGKTMETRTLNLSKNPTCPRCLHPNDALISDSPISCTSLSLRTLSTAQAESQLGKAMFIDVREPHELDTWGMIPGARSIPLPILLSDISVLATLPQNQKIILYCQHGIRSLAALEFLSAQGFSDVAHLDGGFAAWK